MKRAIFLLLSMTIAFVELSYGQDLPQGIYKVREFQVSSNSSSGLEYPVVATNSNNNIYITWSDQVVTPKIINYRKFNSSGDPLTPEQQIRDNIGGDGFWPYICFNEYDDYLIAWLDGRHFQHPEYPGRVWEVFGVGNVINFL